MMPPVISATVGAACINQSALEIYLHELENEINTDL